MEREQTVNNKLNIKEDIEDSLQSLEDYDQGAVVDDDVDIKEDRIANSKDYEFHVEHVKYESASNKEDVDDVKFQMNNQELFMKRKQDVDSELNIKELQDLLQSFDEHGEKSVAFETVYINEEFVADNEEQKVYSKLEKYESRPINEQNNVSRNSCEEDNQPNMDEANNVNATSLCDTKFVHENSLASHMEMNTDSHIKMHAGVRDYKCSICNKKFSKKPNLTEHMKRHAEIREYKCSVCCKAFVRKNDLSKHTKIHTGIRDHKCQICEKTFFQKENLTQHMEIHTEIRNHQCSICGMKFVRKDYLNKHKQIHTGSRDHKCPVCNKKFLRKENLTQHIKIHLGIRDHKCFDCGKLFTRKINLNTHMKKHEKNKL